MDVAFPYKGAITNAYGLIDHTKTRGQQVPPIHPRLLEEKTKGQLSILYGKASV